MQRKVTGVINYKKFQTNDHTDLPFATSVALGNIICLSAPTVPTYKYKEGK